MISKKQKKEIVAGLIEKLRKTQGLYLVDYEGLTVENAIEFRKNFREKGIDYKVAKNSLIKRALEEVEGFDFNAEDLLGMSALAFGFSDPVEPSKVIKDFFDKNKLPKLKAAIIEGQYYDGSRLEEITKLPSREDMIAGIIGSLSAPISGIARAVEDPAKGIVNVLGAVTRDLAYVIEEVAKKQNAA